MSESSTSTTLLLAFEPGSNTYSLGARLTLTVLPLVMIPMLVLASVTYFRSRSLLEDQATSQMLARCASPDRRS